MALTSRIATADSVLGNIALGLGGVSTVAAAVTQVVALLVLSREPAAPTVPDPSGGGTVGAGTNPADGIDLCGAAVPVAWLTVTPPDTADTYKYSKVPINQGTPDDPRVQAFGAVTRALSRQGEVRGSTMTPTLIDTDRVLRDLEATDSLVNAVIEAFVSTEAAVKAGSTPRRVFSGLVTDAEPLGGLTLRLSASDYLQTLLERSPAPTFPSRRFTLTDFPNMGNDTQSETSPGNPDRLGTAVPIGYGLLSDESAGADAIGVVPGVFTGTRFLPVTGMDCDEYVFFGHAPAAFQSLFVASGPDLSTGTDYAARVRITSATGGEWIFPGSAQWIAEFGSQNYRDINGRRYCVAYGRGPVSILHRSGQIPLVANLGGVDDVGDGTGNMVDALARQACHLLINFLLQTYDSGAWLTPPSVNGYSRVRTTSFEAVKTVSDARLAGGHLGAFLLGWDGQGKSLAEVIKWTTEHGIDVGTNRHGQIVASMVDAAASIVRSLTALADTHEGSFRSRRRRDQIINQVAYTYARRYTPPLPKPTPEEGQPLPATPTRGQTAWIGEDESPLVTASSDRYGLRQLARGFELTRDADTAADVAALTTEVQAPGPVINQFQEGLCGTNVDLGDAVELTHFELPSAADTARPMRCERHTLDVDRFTVEQEHLDLSGL